MNGGDPACVLLGGNNEDESGLVKRRLAMPFYYQSGEEVRAGDVIRYDAETGIVEFVADPRTDPENWYVTEHGGGVMLTVWGGLFLSSTADEEDLELVRRADEKETPRSPQT